MQDLQSTYRSLASHKLLQRRKEGHAQCPLTFDSSRLLELVELEEVVAFCPTSATGRTGGPGGPGRGGDTNTELRKSILDGDLTVGVPGLDCNNAQTYASQTYRPAAPC